MATGIYLEIHCKCSTGYCCNNTNDVILNIAVVPLINSFGWLLINKLILNCLVHQKCTTLSKKLKIKKTKNKNKECPATDVIYYFFIAMVIISGLTAIGIYSFQFSVYLKYKDRIERLKFGMA